MCGQSMLDCALQSSMYDGEGRDFFFCLGESPAGRGGGRRGGMLGWLTVEAVRDLVDRQGPAKLYGRLMP